MAVSDAQKRATAKYNGAHYDQLRFDAPKGFKDIVRAAAAAAGVPLAQYIRDAVLAKLNADSVPLCETERVNFLQLLFHDVERIASDESGQRRNSPGRNSLES